MLAVVNSAAMSLGAHFDCNATSKTHVPIPPHGAPFICFNLLLNLSIQTKRSTNKLSPSPIVFLCPFCRHTIICFKIYAILLPQVSDGHNTLFLRNAIQKSCFPIPLHCASFICFNLVLNLSILTSRSTTELMIHPI